MDGEKNRLLVVLVGLPARGKSFVSNKIAGLFRWRGVPCRPVNVGAVRRKQATAPQDASFFSASNEAAKSERERVAMQALHQALGWLLEEEHSSSPRVAIFDATNTTRARRATLLQQTAAFADGLRVPPPAVLFLELICNVDATITSNCLQKCLNSHDYRDMPLDMAMADLRRRIAEYERVYETLDETLEDPLAPPGMAPISYIQSIDLQSKLICRNVAGALPMAVVSLLMAVHLVARPIYLVRAGQCTDDDVRARIRQSEALRMAQAAAAASAAAEPERLATAGLRVHPDDAVGLALSPEHPRRTKAELKASPDSIPAASSAGSNPSMAALTTALTLNGNGQLFARQVARFVLRRTAGGRYTIVPDDSPVVAAAAAQIATGGAVPLASIASAGLGASNGTDGHAGASVDHDGKPVSSLPSPSAAEAIAAAPLLSLSVGPAAAAAASSSPAQSPPPLHSGGGPHSAASLVGHTASGAKLVLRSSFGSRAASYGDGLAEAPGFPITDSDRRDASGSRADSRASAPCLPPSGRASHASDAGSARASSAPEAFAPGAPLISSAGGGSGSGSGGSAQGAVGLRRAPSTGSLLIRTIALQAPPLPMRVKVVDVSGVAAAAHAVRPQPSDAHGARSNAGGAAGDAAAVAAASAGGDDGATPTASLTASTAVSEGASPVGGRLRLGDAGGGMGAASSVPSKEAMAAAAAMLSVGPTATRAAGAGNGGASYASAADLLSYEYGTHVLPGTGILVPADEGFDTDETDGVVASSPVLAQNDHYKREPANSSNHHHDDDANGTSAHASAASAQPVPATVPASTGAGAAAGADAEPGHHDASPLEVFDAEPVIYTSTLPRTIQMAAVLPFRSQQMSALNPMDTGAFRVPIQFLRTASPLGALVYDRWHAAPDRAHARIEGGESLADVVTRLAPFVLELERCRRPTVVISHLSTLQVLLAYFKGVPVADCVDLDFPMACVIELRPHQVRPFASQ